jgi:hypothetical protein
MLIRLFSKEGIHIINLIISERHREELLNLGANYFINTGQEGWEKELVIVSKQLEVYICFDCIGGDIVSRMFLLYNYGNLEAKPWGGSTTQNIIFANKTLRGFD